MLNLTVSLDHVTWLRWVSAVVWLVIQLAVCDSCYAWLVCSVLGSCFHLKSLYRCYMVFILTIGTLLYTVTGLNYYTTSVNAVDKISLVSICSYQLQPNIIGTSGRVIACLSYRQFKAICHKFRCQLGSKEQLVIGRKGWIQRFLSGKPC